MATFSWDNKTQQYRWTSGPNSGKFVSRARVAELTEQYIDQSKERAENIVESLLNRDISVRQFEAGMARVIKFAHVNSYSLGLGGSMRYDSAIDRGIIGARIKKEYRHLRGFSEDIIAGNLSPAQIRARAKQYLNALYGTYELGRRNGHRRNSYNWERDIRNAGESCASCIDIESRGWVEIGTNPAIGVDRICGGNCRCTKEYSADADRPTSSSTLSNQLKSGFGWLGKPLATQNSLVRG